MVRNNSVFQCCQCLAPRLFLNLSILNRISMHPCMRQLGQDRLVRGKYHSGRGHVSIHVFLTAVLLFLHHIFLEVSQRVPSHHTISIACDADSSNVECGDHRKRIRTRYIAHGHPPAPAIPTVCDTRVRVRRTARQYLQIQVAVQDLLRSTQLEPLPLECEHHDVLQVPLRAPPLSHALQPEVQHLSPGPGQGSHDNRAVGKGS